MKLNIYGLQPIIAPRDPELPMEVTTKNYVDSLVDNHAGDFTRHLTADQNAWLDAITVTAEEVNSLAGATNGGLQSQIDQKVNRSGDTLTGALTLAGLPVDGLHAAPKSYVDTEASKRVSLAGDTMTGHLVLHADPVSNMQASTKQYVDSSIVSHANDDSLHLTASQNTWLDAITVSSSEVNSLAGVLSPVQDQLNTKFDKTGGMVTGDINLTAGKTVYVSKTPTTDNELVNKAYVDSRVAGREWKDPITAPDLVSLNSELTPTLEVNVVYVVGPNPTNPNLVGMEGHAFVLDSENNYNFLQGRPVAVGDRFGVNLKNNVTTGSDLLADQGKLITITDATPGAMTYTLDVLSAGSSTLVFDPESPHFGETWSYTDEGYWALTNVSVNLTSGDAIEITGNTVNVKRGTGVSLVDDKLVVKTVTDSALVFNGNEELELLLANSSLTQEAQGDTIGLRLSDQTVANIEDRLSKTEGGSVTAEVVFETNASLVIGYAPTQPGQVVPKQYVDAADSNIQDQVTTLQGKVATLETDPTTQTYVNSQVGTKVSKAGDTMTGYLVLHAAPVSNMQAANKQYVDSSITSHVGNDALHLTEDQNVWIDSITASAQEVNYLTGVTESVQVQLDDKVSKVGSTMTGPLILSGAPVSDLQAATKLYVDSADALKVSKAGDTMTGALSLAGAPTDAAHATTKQYVDDADSQIQSTLTDAIATKVSKAGDTMTGALTLSGAPTNALHAVTKQYVDDSHTSLKSYVDTADGVLQGQVTTLQGKVATLESDPTTQSYVDSGLSAKVNKSGDVLTGYLTLHADPQQAMHAVTKQYVDAVAQGLSVKPAVRVATTGNIAANYNNGTQGVNATLTGTTNGALVVDGVTPVVGDRVLVKNQTLKLQNGDYVVQQVGNASTPFVLKRVVTVDESHEVPGSYFYVFDGATLKGTGWSFIVDNPVSFAIGTDDINVFQFSGQGNLIAGEGLTIDGNTIRVNTANTNRIVVNQDNIDLAATGATPGEYTKVTIDGYGRVLSAASPTTLAGYGISDAQPLNSNLTSLSSASAAGVITRDNNGVVTSIPLTATGNGIIINSGGGRYNALSIVSNGTQLANPSTLVFRDTEGNFAANVITASLIGNASTATALQDSVPFSVTGDATAPTVNFNGTAGVELNVTLANSGVTAGSYTRVTVDAKGRVVMGTNPNTVDEFGIVDAATIDYVNQKFDELEQRFEQLYLYVMGRI